MIWLNFFLWPTCPRVADRECLTVMAGFPPSRSPPLCMCSSGLRRRQNTGREWGWWVGVLVHLFVTWSGPCRKPYRCPSFLLIDPSGGSCPSFSTVFNDQGIHVLLVLPCWACINTAGLFMRHLLRHSREPFPIWHLAVCLCLLRGNQSIDPPRCLGTFLHWASRWDHSRHLAYSLVANSETQDLEQITDSWTFLG